VSSTEKHSNLTNLKKGKKGTKRVTVKNISGQPVRKSNASCLMKKLLREKMEMIFL